MLFKSKEARREFEQLCSEHSHTGGGCGLCNKYLFQLLHGLWAKSCFPTLLSVFVFFFKHGPFFKVFIEFVTILLLFYGLVFWPEGTWELRLPNQGSNSQPPGIGREYLNHWTMREVPLNSTLDSGDQWTHDLFQTN